MPPLRFSLLVPVQGSNDCASAQAIAGEGTFAFVNSSATTDGSADDLCLAYGTAQIERDVWFRWTAATTGLVTIDTCGQTAVDTRLAVHAGDTCDSAVVACNDDTCGYQSEVEFLAS